MCDNIKSVPRVQKIFPINCTSTVAVNQASETAEATTLAESAITGCGAISGHRQQVGHQLNTAPLPRRSLTMRNLEDTYERHESGGERVVEA